MLKSSLSNTGQAPPDRLIFWLSVSLLALGAVVVFSASAHIAGMNHSGPLFFFWKQLFFFFGGLAVLILVSHVPYAFWKTHYRWCLGIGLGLMVLVLFMPSVRGARRWLFLGPFRLQVSEVFRFAMVVFMAATMARRKKNDVSFKKRVVPYLVLLGLGGVLLMLEPDLSAALLLTGTVVAMLFFSGTSIRHIGLLVAPAVIAVSVLVLGFGYKQDRLINFLDGVRDPFNAAYQVRQGIIHMGSGGLFGKGLGAGMAKFLYVPDAHTDFIFASIGEELGLVATVLIVSAYFFLFQRCLRISRRAPDRFSALLAAGLGTSLAIQCALNFGVVLGLLPPTGMPLPLLSYGGSSALFTTAALAVVLNISRYARD
jgi:cell division protein FtsW